MTYAVGQTLLWTPIYFRWDKQNDVKVVQTYRCGSALLSNYQTVDKYGNAWWEKGTLLGRVSDVTSVT